MSHAHPIETLGPRGTTAIFAAVCASFAAAWAARWPETLSFVLWVFRDRGSFIHLDHMLDQGLLLGVNTAYSYGLLPVLVQHILFLLFGRSYWPVVAFGMLHAALLALFFALLIRRLPRPVLWTAIVVLLGPLLIWVDPTLPHALTQILVAYSLLAVAEGRLGLALSLAAAAIFAMPSIPLLLAALVFAVVVALWWKQPERKTSQLLGAMLPAAAVSAALALILGTMFGWRSLGSTLLPLEGLQHYHAVRYGLFGQARYFWNPPGANVRYYLGEGAAWWIYANLLLAGLAVWSIVVLMRDARLPDVAPPPLALFVLLTAGVEAAFVLFAYGPPGSHVYYDFLLAAAVLAGLSQTPRRTAANALAGIFLMLGLLAYRGIGREVAAGWRETSRVPGMHGLYVDSSLAVEWRRIVDEAPGRHVLVIAYGTGAHHFFPTVESPDNWFLTPGVVMDSDKRKLLDKTRQADIVVEELGGFNRFIDEDPDLQALLRRRCVVSSTHFFRTWSPAAAEGAPVKCSPKTPGSRINAWPPSKPVGEVRTGLGSSASR